MPNFTSKGGEWILEQKVPVPQKQEEEPKETLVTEQPAEPAPVLREAVEAVKPRASRKPRASTKGKTKPTKKRS